MATTPTMTIEYFTLAGYFGLLILIGGIFARFNRNLSDFTRGGAQCSWWLVGVSSFITKDIPLSVQLQLPTVQEIESELTALIQDEKQPND